MGANALTTQEASVEEAEAMLHGLTLPQLVRDVRAFHEKFGVPMPAKPEGLSPTDWSFRTRFLDEEIDELHAAWLDEDQAKQLDALVDLVYVAIGTAIWAGWDFEEAWRRVQRANMAKVRTPSADASKRGHAFDVIKPEGWKAPDLSDLVK
jgi:predicted HAD superfamily Cof-like phosphohydrolase